MDLAPDSPLRVTILGTGGFVPERRVTNDALERTWGLESGWIERATGVRERRRGEHDTTLSMGLAAASRALEAASTALEELDLIVAASTAPHQAVPCTAALLQRGLGAPDGRSACFDVNSTCLSWLNALQVAAHLVDAGAYRRALVVSSEVTRHSIDPSEPESAVLLGDAAAAAVIARAETGSASRILATRFATHASGAELTYCLGGGTSHHPNDAGTTRAMNLFHMNGAGVYRMASRLLGPFLDDVLERSGWRRADVDHVVPHQASGRGVDLLTRTLGFRPDQVVRNVETRGNCASAALPLAFAESMAEGRFARGDRVLLIGTGAGLTLGAVTLVY
ncbi:MAG: ketoacyl-ACP synthase III [Planctomycetes bacterium]|nr:ketoacyl-ACP synthase III [Planctomycetota bacterium]